ncbi:MAG: hypothetical protein EBW52_11690, partial [Betaproteobacteria bacterium]|nr:hypothetical protein [Betaproteobacteria bacterium]
NTDLATFTVNGSDVQDGDVVDLAPYTSEVEVVAETVDPDATVAIEGGADLQPGENSLVVTVTAADGETTQVYTVTLNVALGNNTELATFAVNGEDVNDGDVVDLAPYTSEVEVIAEASDPDATVVIEGGTDLQPGENSLVVTVTAADGETTQVYTVTLNVALGNNTDLATFTVNGSDVADGDSVDLEPGTSEVEVVVETVDPDATFEITGGTDLQPGENSLTVVVTAADGETVATYTVTLVVALNDDVSLATFAINGEDVNDGDTINLEYGTTEVDFFVEATDPDATIEVSGDSGLVPGENILTVVVTAADGENTATYTVTLVVALNPDVSLATFAVNGSDVQDGDVVDLAPYTTEVEVVVETVDPDATFEITGGSELVYGENTLTVVVTAADGETTAEYNVTLNVALGNNTDLATFTVNGSDVQDGDVVDLAPYTSEVEVV